MEMESEATSSRKQGAHIEKSKTKCLALPTLQVNLMEEILSSIDYAWKKRKHIGEICKAMRPSFYLIQIRKSF